jgi:hypothetical protein
MAMGMTVCDICGDYSYRIDEPGVCSVCAEEGMVSQMRWATDEEVREGLGEPGSLAGEGE